MRSNEENLPAAGIDNDIVWVFEHLGKITDVFFDSEHRIKAFGLVDLINKYDLASILNHSMAGITGESEHNLLRIFLAEALQICDDGSAIFHAGIQQRFSLLIAETKPRYYLFKDTLIFKNCG